MCVRVDSLEQWACLILKLKVYVSPGKTHGHPQLYTGRSLDTYVQKRQHELDLNS